ncbi:MAG: hypothetical protein PCFJNLEI_03595 [Verrucomicrobiae bacterium]|nr:hypothetical protein [Verrucomicrobiae bacterium]
MRFLFILILTLIAAGVQAAPTANSDNYQIAEDDTLALPAPGLLSNDVDAVTAVLITPPNHGTVDLNPDGAFTYVPDANYNSGSFFIIPDQFQYVAVTGDETSTPANVFITVTPVSGAGDVNLYVESIKFTQRRNALNRDQFAITGRVNPRGAVTDLTGATLALEVNGQPYGIPAPLDVKGRGTSLSSSGVLVQASFNAATGAYSVRVRGLNLTGLGVLNETGLGTVFIAPTITLTGAGLDIPAVSGLVVARHATLADKYTKGLFKFRFYETPTGVFQSLKSTATEVAGQFQFNLAGVITPEQALTNATTGDMRLTIGNHVILIASNLVAGQAEVVLPKGAVPELTKFSLSTRQRSFKISTTPLPDSGLPVVGGATNLIQQVPLVLEFPTDAGTNYFESLIELRRRDAQSGQWAR